MDIFKQARDNLLRANPKTFSINEYLELCKHDKMSYASIAERILKAIGEPELVDTSKYPRFGKLFFNRTIKVYPAFKEFYGMEESIERIVSYFRHNAQGLEEKKQVLYFLGPVGSAKSSLAEKIKELAEVYPIYVLTFVREDGSHEMSPVFETPLGLLPTSAQDQILEQYDIAPRYITGLLSPWAVKKFSQVNGDMSRFVVTEIRPSKLQQIGIAKVEPGDDNNQDISVLVGKTDIRMLQKFSRNDPDSYSFSGGLCRANQGVLEFIEMFKSPLKVLHPLLTATQEGNYVGTESISAIPFNGLVVAHSNESEWQSFKSNKNNEAFLDRICIIKVPYNLRIDEEEMIYKKMLKASDLRNAPCAPQTLKLLGEFCILTRLIEHSNSSQISKMRVYNGENIRETDPHARSLQEYKDTAGVDEGMAGISTRFAFKVLSNTFNRDPDEISADPVQLMLSLEDAIKREQFPKDVEEKYLNYIKESLAKEYLEYLADEIRICYLDAYDDYGQNLFNRYIEYADAWREDIDYKDPDTGEVYSRQFLNQELEKIEKPAGIANPKDFRSEVVNFVHRQEAKTGNKLSWTAYEKLKTVIEKKMFASTEELLPVISFGQKSSKADQKKHDEFVSRMMNHGYTPKQTRRCVDYYLRAIKS